MALAFSPATTEAALDRVGPLVAPLTKKARRGFGGPFSQNVPPSIPFRSRCRQLASLSDRWGGRCTNALPYHSLIVAFRSCERTSHVYGTHGRRSRGTGTRRTNSVRGRARLTGNDASKGVERASTSAIPEAAIMLRDFGPAHGSQPGAQAGRHALEGQKDLGKVGIAHGHASLPSKMAASP